MHLLYLDGSGSPGVDERDHAVFVLLGLAIHERSWLELERRVSALKARYEDRRVPLELHAKEICSSFSEEAEIPDFETLSRDERRLRVLEFRSKKLALLTGSAREAVRKRQSATDAIIHLSRAERSRLYEEALDLVGNFRGARLFAEVVEKRHLFNVRREKNSIPPAFEQVISRFDHLLRGLNKNGPASHGMVVIDTDPHGELMRTMLGQFRSDGHEWGRLRYIIETPFFIDSRLVSGVQLADLCAYATRRYIAKTNRVDSNEEKQFRRIFHRFDRSTALHGIRHYCPPRSCDCLICKARAHARTDFDDVQ